MIQAPPRRGYTGHQYAGGLTKKEISHREYGLQRFANNINFISVHMAAAAAASIQKLSTTHRAATLKNIEASLASCRLPDSELWKGQYDLQMLMLDG